MGCQTNAGSFTLTYPDRLQVTAALPTNEYPETNGLYNIKCFGATDSASVQAAGGVPPYTVLINNTNFLSNDLQRRGGRPVDCPLIINYPIVVTDRNGCTATTSVRLSEPDPLILADWVVVPPTCAGGEDGSIFLRGGQGISLDQQQYTYTITHTDVPAEQQMTFPAEQTRTDTTVTFDRLIEGTYSITVQDRYCTYDTTLTLTAPPPLAIRGRVQPVTCQESTDGGLWATVAGGTPPYRLSYGPRNDTDTLRTVRNLLLNQPDSLLGLSSQPYWIRATDANDCQTEILLDVRSPRQPLSLTVDTLLHVSPISCYGAHDGRVQLTATGGWTDTPYRFGRHLDSLAAGQQSFRDLGAGRYTFYVQDHWGCLDSVRVTLREPNLLTAVVTDVAHVPCHGEAEGQVSLQIEGGTAPYRVSADQGAHWQTTARLTGLTAGAYELWVADTHDCRASPMVVTITEPALLSSRVVSTQDTRCGLAEGAASVSVSGGVAPYQVAWYDEADQTIGTGFALNQLPSGTYTARVQDANQCSSTLTVAISDRDGPVVRLVETQAVRCADERNGSATIEVIGGAAPLTIRWDDGQDQLQAVNLGGGEHRVAVQDANGCRSFLTVPVGEPFPLEITVDRQLSPVCTGEQNGQLSITAQGGNGDYRYAWNTGATTASLEALTAGSYEVTVTDGQGCQTARTFDLTDPEPIVPAIPDTLLLCNGQQATLDAGYPGSTYAWTSTVGAVSQEQTFTALHPGIYEVTVTNEQGCQGTRRTEIIYSNELLKAEFLMASEAQTGDTVVLVDVSWPTPERTNWHYGDEAVPLTNYEVYQELIYDQPGTYEVTLRVGLGECEDEITKSVTISPAEVVLTNGRTASADFIQSFHLAPNPSNGRFVATVVLREVAPIRLRLTDLNSKGAIFDQQPQGKSTYEVAYDLAHLAAGVYLLTLQVEGELQTHRVVIQ